MEFSCSSQHSLFSIPSASTTTRRRGNKPRHDQPLISYRRCSVRQPYQRRFSALRFKNRIQFLKLRPVKKVAVGRNGGFIVRINIVCLYPEKYISFIRPDFGGWISRGRGDRKKSIPLHKDGPRKRNLL